MIDDEMRTAAAALLEDFRARKLMVATAESCTGGLVAACLTEIPGSSDVVDRCFVTYSNAAKQEMLGVPAALLEQYGAVSEATAVAMATGAVARSAADAAIAVTGVAGPGGGSAEKPVGLVHFAAAGTRGALIHRAERFGDIGRAQIRARSVLVAFTMLRELVSA